MNKSPIDLCLAEESGPKQSHNARSSSLYATHVGQVAGSPGDTFAVSIMLDDQLAHIYVEKRIGEREGNQRLVTRQLRPAKKPYACNYWLSNQCCIKQQWAPPQSCLLYHHQLVVSNQRCIKQQWSPPQSCVVSGEHSAKIIKLALKVVDPLVQYIMYTTQAPI